MKNIHLVKQVIVMRKDLGMSPGKLAAQAAHASLCAYQKTPKRLIKEWETSGVTKIVLATYSEQAILHLYKQAVAHELSCSLICDEGRTEVPPGTITCMAIGPARSHTINTITGSLELY